MEGAFFLFAIATAVGSLVSEYMNGVHSSE